MRKITIITTILGVILVLSSFTFITGSPIVMNDGFTLYGSSVGVTDRTEHDSKYWAYDAISPESTDQNIFVSTIARGGRTSAGIIFKERIGSNKLKTDLSYQVSSTKGNAVHIQIGTANKIDTSNPISKLLYEYSFSTRNQPVSGSVNIQIEPSLFNDNANIIVGGIKRGNISKNDINYLSFYVYGTSGDSGGLINLQNTRYQPIIGYSKDPQDMYAIQTFNGGTTITLDEFRFPVKSFSATNSIQFIFENSSTDSVSDSYEIYSKLAYGQSVTVPEGQVWVVPFVFDNSQGIVKVSCSNDFYNTDTGICTKMSGLVYALSQDDLDTEQLTVVATSNSLCKQATGSEAVSIDGETCVQPSPVMENCDKVVNGKCQLIVSNQCKEKGYTWNEETKSCETPIAVNSQTKEVTKKSNPILSILYWSGWGLFAILLTITLITKKRRR